MTNHVWSRESVGLLLAETGHHANTQLEFPPFQRIEDFAEHCLIQDGHRLWDRLFEEASLNTPAQTIDFNQTLLAMEAAANGQGVALVPGLLSQSDLEDGKLVEVWRPEPTGFSRFYILHP